MNLQRLPNVSAAQSNFQTGSNAALLNGNDSAIVPLQQSRSSRLRSSFVSPPSSSESSARLTAAEGDRGTSQPPKNRQRPAKRQRRQVSLRNAGQNTGALAEWTVMVYMAGNTLERYAIQDFLEMAAAGSDARVNVVVQLDRTAGLSAAYDNWTSTRRGLVKPGSTPSETWGTNIGEVNMGSVNTLKNFVTWGTQTHRAKHYALVMWGHGDGFNLSYDDLTDDSISGSELNSVLKELPNKIELVGADACLMSTIEFAHQISENASVLVGSQELEPGTGWNYTPLLQDLKLNPAMTAAQLGSSMVTRYGQTYPTGDETLSAINLLSLRSSNGSSLSSALDRFATTIMTHSSLSDLTTLDSWRDRTNSFGDQTSDWCDIGRLFSGFVSSTNVSSMLRAAGQAVLSAYSSVTIQNYSATVGRSTGLSLYFSDRGSPVLNAYSSYGFATTTQWDEFLNRLWW